MDSAQLLNALQTQYGSAQFDQNWIAQDWCYWDMVGYASQTSFQFFSQPAGALDPVFTTFTKTLEQTNLVQPNQISGAECFVATQVRTFVLNSCKARQTGTSVSTQTNFSAAQRAMSRLKLAIMSQGVMTFQINKKIWLQETLPFQRFPAGFGLGEVWPPFSVATDGTAVYGGTNAYVEGSPYDIDGGKRGDTFTLGQPVFLAPNTQFQASISFPLAASPSPANMYGASNDQTANLWLGVMLCGQQVRPRS